MKRNSLRTSKWAPRLLIAWAGMTWACGLHAQDQVAPVGSPAPTLGGQASPAPTRSAMDGKILFFSMLAEFSARAGDFSGASDYYFQVARDYQFEQLYEQAMTNALRSGSAERALAVAGAWLKAHPRSSKGNFYWLNILISLNQHADTLQALKNTLEFSDLPVQRDVLLDLARLYAKANPLPQAVPLIEKAIAPYFKQPSTALHAWVGIGRLRLLAGDTEGGWQALLEAARTEPDSPLTMALAFILLDQQHPNALGWISLQLEKKADADAVRALSQWLSRNEGPRAAQVLLEQLARQHPQNADLALLLGDAQMRASRWRMAKNNFNRGLTLLATQPEIGNSSAGQLLEQQLRLKRVDVAIKLGQLAEAEQGLAAIDHPKLQLALLTTQAGLLLKKDDIDGARAMIMAASGIDNFGPPERESFLGSLLVEHHKNTAAIAHFERALKAQPDDRDAQYQLATLLEKTGDLKGAMGYLLQLNAAFPDDADLQNALGFMLADNAIELPRAKQLIEAANRNRPGNAMIIDSLGWVLFRLGESKQALAWLELAHSRDADPEIAAHLGEVLWQQGRQAEAIAVWKDAYDPDLPHPSLLKTLTRLNVRWP